MSSGPRPRVWITYAWADNVEGDFAYLVQELQTVGIEATYDRVALVPGRDLWQQIGENITAGHIDGWAYLITPNSLTNDRCREELAYALDRTLNTRGREFCLIGLLHGVRIQDVPPPLRVRLCVSLGSPTWKEEVRAGLEGRPPQPPTAPESRYVWQVHQPYGGVPMSTAVEARPRFGEVMYWRFAVPASASVAQWGHGPAGGGPVSLVKNHAVEGGSGEIEGVQVAWFGAGDRLSPGVSAYVVFSGQPPEFVFFGLASEPFGPPGPGETFRLR